MIIQKFIYQAATKYTTNEKLRSMLAKHLPPWRSFK